MQWDGIDEFLQVVESGSFSQAAERLHLSNSQVSKRVAKLETRLGSRLIYRTTRRLSLTEEGQQYYHHCRQARRHLQAAEDSISDDQQELRGTLRINLAGSFQERFLVPMLAEFMQQHPMLKLELDFSDRPIDIIARGYDLAVCPGPLPDSSMGGRRLAALRNYVVASPDYITNFGAPAEPHQLADFNCLIGTDDHWYFSRDQQHRKIKVSGNWRSDNAHALLAATRSGLGLAQLPYFSVMNLIGSGRLVEVLADWNQYEIEVWAIYPDSRFVPVRVRKFIDFLQQQWQISHLPR